MDKSLLGAFTVVAVVLFAPIAITANSADNGVAKAADSHNAAPCHGNRCTYALYGKVNTAAGSVIEVKVLDEAHHTIVSGTDRTGAYRISNLGPGTYTVRPVAQDVAFDPLETSVTIRDADVSVPAFEETGDWLTPEEAASIDLLPEARVSPETTMLPNGQSLANYARFRGFDLATINSSGATFVPENAADVIMLMLASAEDYACTRSPYNNCNPTGKWNYVAGPNSTIEPAQAGLAYVWDDKTPNDRVFPQPKPLPNGFACPTKMHGLDCSGLISLVASAGGLTAPDGTTLQSNPAKWTVPAALNLQLGDVTGQPIQSGDLVFWPGHDGIATAVPEGGTTINAFISSTGSPVPTVKDPNVCTENINPPRGPRALYFSQFLKGKQPTTVLRLKSNTSVNVTPNPTSLPSTGGSITLTATVKALASSSSTPPTGTVTFTDQTKAVVLCQDASLQNGTATCSKSISQAPDTITATYNGDPNDNSSTGTITVPVTSNYMYGPAFQAVGCNDTETFTTTLVDSNGKTVFSISQSYTNNGSAPGSTPCGPGSNGTPDYLLTPPVPVPLQSGATYTMTVTWSASGPGVMNTAIYGLGSLYLVDSSGGFLQTIVNLGGYVGLGEPPATKSEGFVAP